MKETTIVTMRCANAQPAPDKFGKTVVVKCDLCGHDVWLTDGERNRAALAEGCEVVCHVCIAPEIAAKGEQFTVVPSDKRLEVPDHLKPDFLQYMMEKGLRDG